MGVRYALKWSAAGMHGSDDGQVGVLLRMSVLHMICGYQSLTNANDAEGKREVSPHATIQGKGTAVGPPPWRDVKDGTAVSDGTLQRLESGASVTLICGRVVSIHRTPTHTDGACDDVAVRETH